MKETLVGLPFRYDDDGGIRIGRSRVTLDSVIADFHRGASPEEIVQHYPALDLGDTYLALGYYLQHREEVDRYLRDRDEAAEQARTEYETRVGPHPSRDRWLEALKRPLVDARR